LSFKANLATCYAGGFPSIEPVVEYAA